MPHPSEVLLFDREVGQKLETGLQLVFNSLERTTREEVREMNPAVHELLRDLRGTLDVFLGADRFGK